jgi:hypothetical protein
MVYSWADGDHIFVWRDKGEARHQAHRGSFIFSAPVSPFKLPKR